ncbi:hypothetical protein MMC26_006042 [Xylographa opegraphella]|nr:hypothetical protein [Xylographa opegraphella]
MRDTMQRIEAAPDSQQAMHQYHIHPQSGALFQYDELAVPSENRNYGNAETMTRPNEYTQMAQPTSDGRDDDHTIQGIQRNEYLNGVGDHRNVEATTNHNE